MRHMPSSKSDYGRVHTRCRSLCTRVILQLQMCNLQLFYCFFCTLQILLQNNTALQDKHNTVVCFTTSYSVRKLCIKQNYLCTHTCLVNYSVISKPFKHLLVIMSVLELIAKDHKWITNVDKHATGNHVDNTTCVRSLDSGS